MSAPPFFHHRTGSKSDGELCFIVSNLRPWWVYADREYRQEAEGVGESFWDGQGVEIGAKLFSRFRNGMTCRHVMTR